MCVPFIMDVFESTLEPTAEPASLPDSIRVSGLAVHLRLARLYYFSKQYVPGKTSNHVLSLVNALPNIPLFFRSQTRNCRGVAVSVVVSRPVCAGSIPPQESTNQASNRCVQRRAAVSSRRRAQLRCRSTTANRLGQFQHGAGARHQQGQGQQCDT